MISEHAVGFAVIIIKRHQAFRKTTPAWGIIPYTWPWSPNGQGHVHEWPTPTPLFNVNQISHSEIHLFEKLTMKILGQGHVCGQRSMSHLTLKFKGQGYVRGQTHWSHLRPGGVQSICLFFVPWQSDHFWLRYSKFHIWPRKFKAKVMVNVKPDGHIWGPNFNRYICLSFRGNRSIFGWDIANSIFDLKRSRSRSRRKSTKI